MTNIEKKCECGHFGNEHLWKEGKITIFAIMVPFVRTVQEERGLCRKCSCPKYQQPSLFRPKRKFEYTSLVKSNEDNEQRCRRCGRLLINHGEANHPFQEFVLEH